MQIFMEVSWLTMNYCEFERIKMKKSSTAYIWDINLQLHVLYVFSFTCIKNMPTFKKLQ